MSFGQGRWWREVEPRGWVEGQYLMSPRSGKKEAEVVTLGCTSLHTRRWEEVQIEAVGRLCVQLAIGGSLLWGLKAAALMVQWRSQSSYYLPDNSQRTEAILQIFIAARMIAREKGAIVVAVVDSNSMSGKVSFEHKLWATEPARDPKDRLQALITSSCDVSVNLFNTDLSSNRRKRPSASFCCNFRNWDFSSLKVGCLFSSCSWATIAAFSLASANGKTKQLGVPARSLTAFKSLPLDPALKDQLEVHRRLKDETKIPKISYLRSKKQCYRVLKALVQRCEVRARGEMVRDVADFMIVATATGHDSNTSE
ncbi:uncharacterized protein EDB91DRAFT_1088245 [Suillus paluster]|uniref:uncharacterized protein n=1 Tax=Suillus paluster TaxID=48578 RepID=UPI001B8793EE|nr:uncharacterized protein EDB91DRAFT_1088245 [Suillus paluster]KAG1722115.1 hypothetical protein EDB91DRAFT_1088245 [Suillus paluster]